MKTLYGIDESWSVFCFEPNSVCRSRLERRGITAMPYAAWDEAGPVLFQREAYMIDGPEDGEGSHLKGVGFNLDCHGAAVEEAWAVDFPAFLMSIIPPCSKRSFVVIKMDIEGAEYTILRKMLRDGSIDRVDVLHVEFHERLMTSENDASTAELRDELERRVNVVQHW